MEYSITATSTSTGHATISAKSNTYVFGVAANQTEMAGPTELLLSAFAACCLKNVERFSSILHYSYNVATIEVTGQRQEKPAMINTIHFTLHITTNDAHLNGDLLLKNIQKFGTIYNTLNAVCEIDGQL
jgi:uncharacterized OsmC-like protein